MRNYLQGLQKGPRRSPELFGVSGERTFQSVGVQSLSSGRGLEKGKRSPVLSGSERIGDR